MNGPVNDIHALSGAYAVDALDDDERARFEEHLVAEETVLFRAVEELLTPAEQDAVLEELRIRREARP